MFMLLQVFPSYSPLSHFLPASPSPLLSQSPYHCPCLWFKHKCSLVNPFTIFHQRPPFPPAAVSLFCVSMFLFLFCSLVYCAHYIPHISELRWYLSFPDWLILLSIIVSRSIHAVVKGKSSFFLTAALYSIV